MHLEKGQSTEAFGIHHAWCVEHQRKEILVYDGKDVYTLAFESQEEYELYLEFGTFYGKVLKMREEFFSQEETP